MDAFEPQLHIILNQIFDKAQSHGDEELVGKLQRITQSLQYVQSQLDDDADLLMRSLQLKLKDELLKFCVLLKQKYCIVTNKNISVWLLSIE